jgi:Cu(I)/Ag(I) efflux system membrane fusion protein
MTQRILSNLTQVACVFGLTIAFLCLQIGAVSAASNVPLYYQDPDAKPYYSAIPKKTSDGRDFVAVYTDAASTGALPSAANTAKPNRAASPKGKILYYRNAMGLAGTSPVPKKDSMGMDYIPVYADEVSTSGTVQVSPQRMQMLGVRTELVKMGGLLTRTVRATGAVSLDERTLALVTTKTAGWVEKLRVAATGEPVTKGEVLLDFYSPDLVTAEEEYLIASSIHARGAVAVEHRGPNALVQASLDRLRAFNVPEGEIARLERTGKASRVIQVVAPADGVILEKQAVVGMRIEAGMPLYRTANLLTVWVIAEVQEQDLGRIQQGQQVSASFVAFPGRSFNGTIDLISATLSAETRTAKLRIVVPNPDLSLRGGMYGTVAIATTGAAPEARIPVVPDSAVIDSGTQQFVLVEKGEGKFEPRSVHIGAHGDGVAQVLSGVMDGERVVVSANFLIDAESNLRAALQAFVPPPKADHQAQPEGETR